MATTQTKSISTLVAEQLGVELGPCTEYNSEQHAYDIENTDNTLWINFNPVLVEVYDRDSSLTKLYNIRVTLQEVDGIDRAPFQQRVIDEERELAARLDKLCRFLETEQFNELPWVERDDLLAQARQMTEYRTTLRARISRFNT